ncbi:MAG: type II secretion system F family protein, partial [Caulobacteraceae bacterium]
MAMFRYRAATVGGAMRTGAVEAPSQARVIADLRRLGLIPIEAVETAARRSGPVRARGRSRQGMINALGELAVLLEAGLTLDRALTVCAENILAPEVKTAFSALLGRVREGAPLSTAMNEASGFFPPMAAAMAEAGEADGRLGAALARLAASLDRAEALRQTVISSLIYPAVLTVVATSVVLVMLLVVVPQFDTVFAGSDAKLPLATRIIMGASEGVRSYGWLIVLALILAILVSRQWLKRPTVRLAFDRLVLGLPQIGPLVIGAETAIFARTLGSL